MLLEGRLLASRFRIVAFLGRGATGEVYEAEDMELGAHVAVKVLRPEVAADATSLERFRREVQLARRISHPHVCRLFHLFEDRKGERRLLFLTMELLHGETLRERLEREGRLTTEEALPLVRQMAAALVAAHATGIVHRDLKSSNVFLQLDGDSDGASRVNEPPRVVLTDFGLARALAPGATLTNSGLLLGSPAYMAPEQVRGEAASPVSDLYSLGVVMYEMVTGGLPFEGDTAFGTALKRLHEAPLPPRQRLPELDPVWEAVILRCLDTDPARRFSSPDKMVAVLEGREALELAARPRRSGWSFVRAATLAAVLLLLVLGVWWGFEGGSGVDAIGLADALLQQGDLDAAEAAYQEVLPEGPGATTKVALEASSRAYAGLVQVAAARGDLSAARGHAHRAVEVERRRGTDGDLTRALHRLAVLDYRLGNVAAARRGFSEMMMLARIQGDDALVATAWDLLALLAHQRGNLPSAARAYAASLEIHRGLADEESVASLTNSLGTVRMHQGELTRAEELLAESLERYQRLGSMSGEAAVRVNRTTLLRRLGRMDEALEQIERAVASLTEDNGAAKARAEAVLGELLALRGRREEGRQHIERAVSTLERIGGNRGLDLALTSLGRVQQSEGDLEGARETHRRALALRQEVDDRLGGAENLTALAELALTQSVAADGVAVEAEALARQAVEQLERCGARDLEAHARLLLARALLAQGEREAARKAFEPARARAEVTESPGLRRKVEIRATRWRFTGS